MHNITQNNIIYKVKVECKMINITNGLVNIYLLATFAAFGYLCWQKMQVTDNYFAAALLMLDSPFSKLLIYNVVIAVATVVYKLMIALFYGEVKENQTLNLIERLGYKIVQLCYFLYVMGESGFGIHTFISLAIIFTMFISHNIAIARSSFLINAHVTENMGMNFRLLSHFLLMIFLDFQMVNHTFFWLFSSELSDSSYVLFAYYCITISMSIIEPAVCFILHFYQVYTNSPIQNSDIFLVKIKFIIIIPRMIIQLLLSILIADRFSLYLLMIFKMIEPINQISKAVKSYNSMKKLIQKMKHLKQLNKDQIELHHDKVCTVCFSETTTSALILPCKHIFHKECLRQWIVKNSNHHCPKCKTSFDFQNTKTQSRDHLQNLRRANEQMKIMLERNDPLDFKRGPMTPMNNIGQNVLYANNQEKMVHTLEKNQDNIQIVKVGENHIAKLQATKKSIKKRKPEGINVGSVPFGLPTQAIYRRREKDMVQRNRIKFINQKMIKFMKMDPAKQLLFVPQFS